MPVDVEQFDVEAATWVKPAEATKTARSHRVPLSRQALDVLAAARKGILDGRDRMHHANGGITVNGDYHPRFPDEPTDPDRARDRGVCGHPEYVPS